MALRKEDTGMKQDTGMKHLPQWYGSRNGCSCTVRSCQRTQLVFSGFNFILFFILSNLFYFNF
jgi:hypothetical protein